MLRRTTIVLLLVVALSATGLAASTSAQPGADTPETVRDVVEGLPAAAGAQAQQPRDSGGTWAVSDQFATIPFSFLGMRVPAGVEVEVRFADADGDWSAWEEAEVAHPDEGPDVGSPEHGGHDGHDFIEGVWAESADRVQVRVAALDGEDVDLGAVDLHLIDSMGLGRSVAQRAVDAVTAAFEGTPPPAAAAVGAPDMVSREGWGANETLRREEPTIADQVDLGIVHHTAGSNDYSEASGPGLVRGIYEYHVNARGWNDIGYNFLVDKYGTLYEGRFGGAAKGVIGAHAGGFNTSTTGISVMGTYGDAAPPVAAQETVAELLAWKYDVHHIDPTAEVTVTSRGSTRFPDGQDVTLPTVIGHRDVSTTDCPGDAFYARLGWLADRIDARGADMFVRPDADTTRLQVEDDRVVGGPVTITAGLKPAGAWDLEVTDPDGAVVHSDTGSGERMSSTWAPEADPLGTYTWRLTDADRRPAIGEVDLVGANLRRIGNSTDPVEASVQMSKTAFATDGGAARAVIARDDVFADAMVGGPLAGSDGALLLNSGEVLEARVAQELERVLDADGTVYVLGGRDALGEDVVDGVRDALGVDDDSDRVQRVAGAERAATSAAVAELVLERSEQTTAMVARYGPDDKQPWADALSGGAYGARHGIPVLLSRSGDVPKELQGVLRGLDSTIVLGGEAAISGSAISGLPDPRRVAGKDRAGTAAAVAAQLWGRTAGADGDRFVIGGGYSTGAWAYALAAAPLAAQTNAPLLLVYRDDVPPETERYLDGLGYSSSARARGWVVGPTEAVQRDVADRIANHLQ